MVSYPVELKEESDGTFRVSAPHFPEFETIGETADDAMMHAAFALEEAIAERMAKRQVVPIPLKALDARHSVTLADTFTDLLESYWKFNLGTFPPDRRE